MCLSLPGIPRLSELVPIYCLESISSSKVWKYVTRHFVNITSCISLHGLGIYLNQKHALDVPNVVNLYVDCTIILSLCPCFAMFVLDVYNSALSQPVGVTFQERYA